MLMNRLSFKHSSRDLPLRLSTNALYTGFPGRMKSSFSEVIVEFGTGVVDLLPFENILINYENNVHKYRNKALMEEMKNRQLYS